MKDPADSPTGKPGKRRNPSGGRIGGGRFPRPPLPLSLLFLGLIALAWAAAPRPVVIHQQIHNDAPEQVFNAPVRVEVNQQLPIEPGRSVNSLQMHQALVEADSQQEQAVKDALEQLKAARRAQAAREGIPLGSQRSYPTVTTTAVPLPETPIPQQRILVPPAPSFGEPSGQ